MVVTVDDASVFAREINQKNKLVVVDFFATWCGPCKQIAPFVEQLSSKYAKEANFLKVDVDNNQDIAKSANVSALPTFVFYANGAIVDSIKGANPAALEQKVKELSAKHTKTPFSGAGYALGGPGSGSGTAQPAKSDSTSAPAARRPNPWADPNFMPGKKATTTTSTPSSSQSSSTTAVTRPTTQAPSAQQQATSTAQSAPQRPTAPAAANAPARTADVARTADATLLTQLLDMGFSQNASYKACIHSRNTDLDAAVAWLMDHQDDADIDAPITQSNSINTASQPSAPALSSTAAAELVAESGVAAAPAAADTNGAAPMDMDEDERVLYEEVMKKKRAEQAAVHASAPKNTPMPEANKGRSTLDMSHDEKMEWLKNRRSEVAKKREVEAIEKEKSSYKATKGMTAALNDLKEQREEHDRQQAIARKKKEEAEKHKHRSEVLAKLAADKERRKAEHEKSQREIEQIRKAKEEAAKNAK